MFSMGSIRLVGLLCVVVSVWGSRIGDWDQPGLHRKILFWKKKDCHQIIQVFFGDDLVNFIKIFWFNQLRLINATNFINLVCFFVIVPFLSCFISRMALEWTRSYPWGEWPWLKISLTSSIPCTWKQGRMENKSGNMLGRRELTKQ